MKYEKRHEKLLNEARTREENGEYSEAGRLYENASEVLREIGSHGPSLWATEIAQECYAKVREDDNAMRMRLTRATKGRVVFADLPDRINPLDLARKFEACN